MPVVYIETFAEALIDCCPTFRRISGGAAGSRPNHPLSPVRWIRLLGRSIYLESK
jgi:hypothetical protein